MCEQTEVHYLEGDVVWVKLGACWWPGRVRDVDKLPDDILESFRKKPIAAVQFFNEDKYEYVKNLDQICRYNCRRKTDFIKKGLDMFRAKQREGSSFMDKFPNDVSMAEQLTGGNPDIVTDHTFAPEEKPSYRGIFGGEKKSEKKGKMSSNSPTKGSPSWRSKLGSSSSPGSPVTSPRRPITHPRIIRMLKGEEEQQHDVRIRQQPVTPQRETSPQGEPYKCYKCDFTSKRLNVVILHSKSHSGDGATNGQEPKHIRNKNAASVATPHRGRGRPRGSHSGSVGRPPKNSPKVMSVNSMDIVESSSPKNISALDMDTEEKTPKETLPSPEKKNMKSPIFGKRKGSKATGDKATKKKKSSEDFREKLLAEWEDEDQEEEEKEMMILKQELSKSEALSSPPPDRSTENVNYSTNKISPSSNVKPKEISCFDFDEKADSLLDHELEERAKKFAEARKFPRRIDDRIEMERRLESVEAHMEEVKYKEVVSPRAVVEREIKDNRVDENKDLHREFENIMAETEVPSLPAVPGTKTSNSEREPLQTGESPVPEDALEERAELDEHDLNEKRDENMHSEVPTEHCIEPPESNVHLQKQVSKESPVELPSQSAVELPAQTSSELPSECSNHINIELPVEPPTELPSEPSVGQSAGHLEQPGELHVETANLSKEIGESPELPTTSEFAQPTSVSESHIAPQSQSPKHVTAVQQPAQISLVEEQTQASLAQQSLQMSVAEEPLHVTDPEEAVQMTTTHDSTPISTTLGVAQISVTQDLTQMSVSRDVTQMPVTHDLAPMSITQDPTLMTVAQDPVQMTVTQDSAQIAVSQDPAQMTVTQDSPPMSVTQGPVQMSLTQELTHMSVTQESEQMSITQESAQMSISQEPTQMPIVQEPVQMSLEEMDLDINSMPVVMGDTLITDDSTTKLTVLPTNSVAITLPPPVPSEKPVVQPVMRIAQVSAANPTSTASPSTVTLNVTPTLELVTEANTSVIKSSAQTTTVNSAPKIVKQVVKSVKIQPGPSGTLRTADGSIIAPKGAAGGGRYVLIQHSSGKQTLYTTGKPGQQCVAVKASQGQGAQQTVGKKLVIVKSPQGTTVSPEVLTSLQQGLSSGGKIVPQRIITSQGTILKQVGRNAPKVMHVTPQQMKALTSGKQVGGTKLTMQSTPTKVVLPAVQKMMSQGQGVKVVTSATTAKSKPNTILIQTTQGTSVGSAIVTRTVTGNVAGATTSVHAKLSAVPQTVVRQVAGAARSKIVATASPSGTNVQRVVVSTAGRGAVLQGQPQQKVIAARSGVQPRMLMQKARSTTAVRVPNVGAIGVQSQVTQVQQVKKVQGMLPRTQVLQKRKQGQVMQKLITVQQPAGVTAIKATSSTEAAQTMALPSLQPLQPEINVTPTIQQNLQPNTLVLSSAPTVISQNLATTQSALPVATSAPLLSHEHIAQVITPTGSEQLGEGGTATYVLVTIDDQGAIQPYDSSGLVTSYDGGNQSSESNTRTLYIDPSSLGSSGDLENILLAINNPASATTGALLNIGPTNTVSGSNISTTQHSQSVFNIADSQPAAPAGSQDILAAALANTDVFQSDGTMSDSLTVVNSSQSSSGSVMTSRLLESSSLLPSSTSTTLHQTTVLLPSLSASAMPPANTAGVLETSLTLNQPIMTPLEVPSSVTNLQQPAPPIPTSLELPLTITQPVLSMPSTSPYSALPQQGSLQTQETESVESPISSSSISQTVTQPLLSARPTLQPSMPLLSEDVSDSQAAVAAETQVDTEHLGTPQPGSSFNSAETTCEQDAENLVASATPHSVEHVLPSYAQVPEVSSHATEDQDSTNNGINYESNPVNQQLSDQDLSTSYHEVPESTSEAGVSVLQGSTEIGETQSASEQTVSTSYARNLQDTVPKERTEIIDSSNPPTTETLVPNYSLENSSEAVAVKDMTGPHESSPTDNSCIPYEQVESTSQLREGTSEAVTDATQTLPSESTTLQSYTPAPESTSSVSGEVLESNSSGTFSLPSYSQTPESTCELQEEKEVTPNQSASGSYSQVPESTSHMSETRIVGDSPMDILDSSQHSLDSSVLTPYQVPESSSEASVVSYEDSHATSGVTPPSSNQTGYTSCSQVPESTSQMHEVLTFSDSSTEVSDCAVPLAQSMPLLLDTGPGPVGTKRHLDGEGTDNANDLDHSKRVKIEETER